MCLALTAVGNVEQALEVGAERPHQQLFPVVAVWYGAARREQQQ